MANRGPDLIASAGEQNSRSERSVKLVDNLSTEVVRPHYRYIETQVMNAGVGRLGTALSYAHTVDRALGELSNTIEGIRSDKVSKSRENIHSYERLTSLSNHLAASEALTNYQIDLQNRQLEHLEKNPSGEGLYDLTLNSINEMGRGILSTFGTAELRATLQTNLNQMAVHELSHALTAETQKREAFAAERLDGAIRSASALISQGSDVGDAIGTLNPAIEALPTSMPHREKYILNARNALLMQSLDHQCLSGNPNLAERNLKEEMYKSLSPEQRREIEHRIFAKRKDQQREAQEARENNLLFALTDINSSFSKMIEETDKGNLDFFELKRLHGEGKIENDQYNFLVKRKAGQNLESFKQSAYDNACREVGRREGSYASLPENVQTRFFSQDLLTRKIKDEFGQDVYAERIALDSAGQPILDEFGRPKMERRALVLGEAPLAYICEYAKRFSVPLPELQDRIMAEVMNSPDPARVADAIKAWESLARISSPTLGSMNSEFNKEMSAARSLAQSGTGAAAIRAKIASMRMPLDDSTQRELNRRLGPNGDAAFDPNKIEGNKFDRDNSYEVNEARLMYEDHFYASRGDSKLAYRNVSNMFESTKKESDINGSEVISNGRGFSVSSPGDGLREKVTAYASDRLREIFSSEEGRATNGITSFEIPEKVSPAYNDMKMNGVETNYFLVPTRPDSGEFYVRWNFKNRFSWSKQRANLATGYAITDPETGAPLVIKLKDALRYKAEEKIEKLSAVMERIANPPPAEAQDLQMAFGSKYPAEVDRVIQFYGTH